MRICMISEDYPPAIGGGGRFVSELSGRLHSQYGHEVEVVSRPHGPNAGERNEDGVKVVRIPGSRAVFVLRAVFRVLFGRKFDVYHAHGAIPGMVAKIVGTIKGGKTILHVHGYREREVIGAVKYFVQNFVLRLGYSKIISVDETGAGRIISLGVPKEKVEVVPVGIDTETFEKIKRTKNRIPVFLFVGRLEKVKDLATLLKAAKTLGSGGFGLGKGGLKAEFRIVGGGSMRAELEKFAEANGLGNVKFFGLVPHERISGIYAKADFFVLSSLSEGMPLVLLEAMASGLPVITSDISSLSAIVKESNAGGTFMVGDENALAGTIKKLCGISASEYGKLSANARKYVEKNYSWEEVAAKINGIYSKLP